MPLARISNGDNFSAAVGVTSHAGTLYPSAARTATPTDSNGVGTDDHSSSFYNTIIVIVDITNVGTGSINVVIEGKDIVSGKYWTILDSGALIANQTKIMEVNANLTAVANSIAKDILPSIWRVRSTHNNVNTITYSVGAHVLAA